MTRYCLPAIFALTIFAVTSEAKAQRSPGFASRPAISPYINLFRGNTGGINSFFSFVRPVQEQLRFNQNQLQQNRRFQQQFQFNQFNQMSQAPVTLQDVGGQLQLLRSATPGVGQPANVSILFQLLALLRQSD